MNVTIQQIHNIIYDRHETFYAFCPLKVYELVSFCVLEVGTEYLEISPFGFDIDVLSFSSY